MLNIFSPFVLITGSSPQVCHEYLVSGQHGVANSKLTASTIWSNVSGDDHGPHRARLFTTAVDYGNGTYLRGAWSAKINDKNQYIQVNIDYHRDNLIFNG